MENNIPDPPKEALAGFDDATAALQAVKSLAKGVGRNAGALRTIFVADDAALTPTDVALSKAKNSVQRPRPKSVPIAPSF